MDGTKLALGAVSALALAAVGLARGSRGLLTEADIARVRRRLVQDLAHAEKRPEVERELWRRRAWSMYRDGLDRVEAQKRSVGWRETGGWREVVLAQPFLYHVTVYDFLADIRVGGLLPSKHDEGCLFLTTKGGLPQWTSWVPSKEQTYRGRHGEDSHSMATKSVVLRVSTGKLQPDALSLDKGGTEDARASMGRSGSYLDEVDPGQIYAVCYRSRIPVRDLEWARVSRVEAPRKVRNRMRIEVRIDGPWLALSPRVVNS